MTNQINPFERAIMDVAREMTEHQLTRRIPDIPQMDYRRIAYCLIEDRIELYKVADIKLTLDKILAEFGITKKAYYNWYEKYHSYYLNCKNRT